MPLAAWVRERLWRANDWVGELADLRKIVLAEPSTLASAGRILDLAWATELCDPDRSRALGLYIEAWRRGRTEAVARVKVLATALHAYVSLAELALAEGDLLAAGTAFVDAGLLQMAVDPLQRCVDTATGALPKADLQTLLALAKGSRIDAEAAIKSSLERARGSTGRPAATLYVHAARLARAAELRDQLPAIFAAATRACPDDDEVMATVERWLLEKGDPEELLAHYRGRFERAATRPAYVERVRAAGVELVARDLQPGLGLRLVRMALKHAYEAQCPGITSHIAAWELIVAHARSQHSTLELVPMIVEAMATAVTQDIAVYLARLGLEIAWRDATDTLAAQPYAAMLLDFVKDHPFATAFVKEIEPANEAVPASEPTPLSITFVRPTPAPAAPPVAAAPIASPGKPLARIPFFKDGPVKRAESPRPPVSSRHSKGGRLALLTPPPARTTTLRRDTSPFPVAPTRREKPTLRAPRKVVPVDVVVEMPSGSWFSTVLRDISTSGAFVLTKRPVEVGTLVSLEMRIPKPGALVQVSHRTNARIARRSDLGWGLAFVDAPAELIAAIDATAGEEPAS